MNAREEFKPVLTRAFLALQQKNKTNEFKALVFEEPKYSGPSRKVQNHAEAPTNETDATPQRKRQKDETEEFDIKRARHEVLNFAMQNQRSVKNKKKMLMFQAVKLGAKPAKKKYKNYKELIDERTRLKQIREDRKKFHQLGKNQTGAASIKCRSKTKQEKQNKKRAPVSSIDQHYGKVNPKLKKKK